MRYQYKNSIVSLFCCAVLSGGLGASFSANGQEQLAGVDEDLALLYGDEETISIATGTYKPIHLAPSVATVITAKDIEAMGATSLHEVMVAVPGVHVGTTLHRTNPLYSVRGIQSVNNAQLLVLIDNRRFNALFPGGLPNNFYLPVKNIARIEVIRGPVSAVHGADAFSGVINIVTKSAADLAGTHAGGRFGSFDRKSGWLQHGGSLDDWQLSFSLEYDQHGVDSDRVVESDLQTSLDGSFGTSASLAPAALDKHYRQTNSHLGLSNRQWNIKLWDWQIDDVGQGLGAGQSLDQVGRDYVSIRMLDVAYNNADLVDNWELGANLNLVRISLDARFVIFPPGTKVLIGDDGNLFTGTNVVEFPDGVLGNPGNKDELDSIEFKAFYTGLAKHRARLTTGFRSEKETATETKNFGIGVIDGSVSPIDGTLTDVSGTPYIYINDNTRKVGYLTLQDEWQFAPDWELTGGVRYDHYSDFGSTVNPRLALVWATRYNLTSKLLYGSAFRPPSFNELYAQANPSVIGNPNLNPETIDTVELAFDYRPTFELQTVVSLFHYEIDGLIDFSNSIAQNNQNRDGDGVEATLIWKPGNSFSWQNHFSWQRAKDEATGTVVGNAPARRFYSSANWMFKPAWSINGGANWVMDRARATTDARPDISDYVLVNLAIQHSPAHSGWTYRAAVHNLFDRDAREPSDGRVPNDYPLEGRSAYLELAYHFEQ